MMTRSLLSLLFAFTAWMGALGLAVAQDLAPVAHATLQTDAAPTVITFTSSGTHLLVGTADGRLHVWALANRRPVHVSRLDGPPAFVAALDDTGFVSVTRGGTVLARSFDGDEIARYVTVESGDGGATTGTGDHLAVLHDDVVTVRRVTDGALLGTLDASDRLDGKAVFVGFDRLGQQLAVVTDRGEAVFWNPVTHRVLRQTRLTSGDVRGSRSKVHVIASRPRANLLVAGIEEVALPPGGLDARARPGDLVRRDVVIAYDWERAMEIGRMPIPDGQIEALAVGPGPDHVAVLRVRANDVQIYDLRAGTLAATIPVGEAPEALAISDDDRWLAVGLPSGTVAVWALSSTAANADVRADQRLPSLAGRIRVVGEKTPALAPGAGATVAVLPFEGRGAAADRALAIADMLTTTLANVDGLTLVERLRIDALLDELALQKQGITRSQGLELGRMLQADFVVLGSIDVFESSYLLNARLLKVETSEVVSGRQVVCEECRAGDLVDAVRTLGTTLAGPGQ